MVFFKDPKNKDIKGSTKIGGDYILIFLNKANKMQIL